MKFSELKPGNQFYLLGQKDQRYIKTNVPINADVNAVHVKTGVLDYIFPNEEIQLINIAYLP